MIIPKIIVKSSSKGGALGCCIVVGAVGVVVYCLKKKYGTKKDIEKQKVNSKLKQAEDDNHAKNTKDIVDNEYDNKIRIIRAETDEKLRLKKGMLELYGIRSSTTAEQNQHEPSLSCWINNFHSLVAMPGYEHIPLLKQLLDGCPKDFKDTMLLHLLTMTGGLCFSKVRAKYNGDLHAPNLLTIVEGKQGSGKSRFDAVYKKLFHRIIEQDRERHTGKDSTDRWHYYYKIQAYRHAGRQSSSPLICNRNRIIPTAGSFS